MVMIDGVLCTNQYVVLKLKPMHGTRINDIISIQSSIESAIGMKSLMNVMYKKGYIGILLPISSFYRKRKNPHYWRVISSGILVLYVKCNALILFYNAG